MEKLFEGKSLRFICNVINMGLGLEEYEVENFSIVSAQKPHVVVKVLDIDISDFLIQQLKNNKLQIGKNATHAESNFYDYVVLTSSNEGEKEDEKETLLVLSLMDMIMMNDKILADESGKHTESGTWSLDSEEWDLLVEQ